MDSWQGISVDKEHFLRIVKHFSASALPKLVFPLAKEAAVNKEATRRFFERGMEEIVRTDSESFILTAFLKSI